ncbi:TPA: hypothetical protein ACWV53_005041, partial [Salmonella enterica subsp. enterica serovar Muenchen]
MITKAIILVSVAVLALTGCTHHQGHEKNRFQEQYPLEPDLLPVIASLHDQLHLWRGTPLRNPQKNETGIV